jgi:hypothetical protein
MPSPFLLRRITLAALLVASVPPAWPRDDCDVPTAAWQPRQAVLDLARRNGWQVHHVKVDDGCYELKGLDADGRRFKAKLDPATLRVLRIRTDQERRHGPDRDRDHQRGPAPAAAPASAGG